MLSRILVTTLLATVAQAALGADAGKIIFVAGSAQVAGQPAAEGGMVQEGQLLTTGRDGYIYVKTIDNGLFVLRPQTKARIVAYHVDTQHPANTQVKLELISGVARSKSGDAVKQARQNFRFNTPVAAIGVRGTDFTVFTDENTSRVAVITGGVIVSGFAGACSPEGTGPCEGTASRVLSATQRGQLLEVTRGQAAPKLLSSSTMSPDLVSPPRSDEPLAKAGAGAEPNLEAEKSAALNQVIEKTVPPVPPPPVLPPPVISPTEPDRVILWGRWNQVAGVLPQIDLVSSMKTNNLVAINGNYALLTTPGHDFVSPTSGSIGFALKNSEAFIYTDYGPTSRIETPAAVNNGKLTVDFGSRSFATSLDLVSGGTTTLLRGEGTVGGDGRMYGNPANGQVGLIDIQGMLSNDKGGSASYLFNGRLDSLRTVNGATSWLKR